MATKNLVSIILPVRNVAPYLGACLDSLLSQTYTHLEIICIVNGSQDESLSIIKEYQKKDARIIVLLYQEPLGIGGARNPGITECSGEYIMFCDPDDILSSRFVQILTQKLEEDPLADFVFTTNMIKFMEREKDMVFLSLDMAKKILPSFCKNEEVRTETLFLRKVADSYGYLENSPCNRIFRTSFLKKQGLMFAKNRTLEDIPFSLLCDFLSHRVIFLGPSKSHAYFYRQRKDSTMNTEVLPIFDLYAVWDFYNNDPKIKKSFSLGSEISKKVFFLLLWEAAEKLKYRYFTTFSSLFNFRKVFSVLIKERSLAKQVGKLDTVSLPSILIPSYKRFTRLHSNFFLMALFRFILTFSARTKEREILSTHYGFIESADSPEEFLKS